MLITIISSVVPELQRTIMIIYIVLYFAVLCVSVFVYLMCAVSASINAFSRMKKNDSSSIAA